MWRIKNWDAHFENNKSREVESARWVPIKNKQDGDGYLTLLDFEDGPACYGAFVAMVLLASKCSPRGELRQSNWVPHSVETISRKVHMPVTLIQRAIKHCCNPTVDWMEAIPTEQDGLFAGSPSRKAPERHSERQAPEEPSARNGSGNRTSSPHGEEGVAASAARRSSASAGAAADVVIEFLCSGQQGAWSLTQEHLNRLITQFPSVRVHDCLSSLATRQIDETGLRRTAKGMSAFLHNWLTQEVDRYRQFSKDGTSPAKRVGGNPSSQDRVRRMLEST